MVNKVILVGNVGRNPEVQYVGDRPMAWFSLATTEQSYRTSEGAVIPERTEWHRIVMWGKDADTAERYITKGTKMYIEGKLRTRQWTDRNGIQHSVTEIYADSFDILQRPVASSQGARP